MATKQTGNKINDKPRKKEYGETYLSIGCTVKGFPQDVLEKRAINKTELTF